MTPAETIASYRDNVLAAGEEITIRRYTSTGLNRTKLDQVIMARVTGYNPDELVGGIQQGDRRIICLAEDLTANVATLDSPPLTIVLPLTSTDKVVLRGKELAIIAFDDSTRRVQGVLIAYEIQARG